MGIPFRCSLASMLVIAEEVFECAAGFCCRFWLVACPSFLHCQIADACPLQGRLHGDIVS